MTNETNDCGFQIVTHEPYASKGSGCDRVVQQSSAVGYYPDSWDKPGSSYLWVGPHLHLDRVEVAELRDRLNHWLATGYLFPRTAAAPGIAVSAGDEAA